VRNIATLKNIIDFNIPLKTLKISLLHV